MTEVQFQQTKSACVKAASVGFAQTLINKGYSEDQVKQATVLYAHPTDGLLEKRASNKAALQQCLLVGAARVCGRI